MNGVDKKVYSEVIGAAKRNMSHKKVNFNEIEAKVAPKVQNPAFNTTEFKTAVSLIKNDSPLSEEAIDSLVLSLNKLDDNLLKYCIEAYRALETPKKKGKEQLVLIIEKILEARKKNPNA